MALANLFHVADLSTEHSPAESADESEHDHEAEPLMRAKKPLIPEGAGHDDAEAGHPTSAKKVFDHVHAKIRRWL